jgi:hypothetical protein
MPLEMASTLIKTLDCGKHMYTPRGSPVFVEIKPNHKLLKITTNDNWRGLDGKILHKLE